MAVTFTSAPSARGRPVWPGSTTETDTPLAFAAARAAEISETAKSRPLSTYAFTVNRLRTSRAPDMIRMPVRDPEEVDRARAEIVLERRHEVLVRRPAGGTASGSRRLIPRIHEDVTAVGEIRPARQEPARRRRSEHEVSRSRTGAKTRTGLARQTAEEAQRLAARPARSRTPTVEPRRLRSGSLSLLGHVRERRMARAGGNGDNA